MYMYVYMYVHVSASAPAPLSDSQFYGASSSTSLVADWTAAVADSEANILRASSPPKFMMIQVEEGFDRGPFPSPYNKYFPSYPSLVLLSSSTSKESSFSYLCPSDAAL